MLGLLHDLPSMQLFLRNMHVMLAALAELKQGLRGAELVQLAPGEVHVQQSSWVLLKGTLRITGHAAFVPAGMPGLVSRSNMRRLTWAISAGQVKFCLFPLY